MTPAARAALSFSVGIAIRPLPGETLAGDAGAAIPCGKGVLVALADGLGHGPPAASAAAAFLESVKSRSDARFEEIFAAAHRDLLRTRGAVAAIARFDRHLGEVEVGGIGNVSVFLRRAGDAATEHVLTVPGILGSSFRRVRSQAIAVHDGDRLFFHTDGVRSRLDLAPTRDLTAQQASEYVLAAGAKPTDDAGCAVVFVANAPAERESAPPRVDLDARGVRELPIRVEGDAACAAVEARSFGARLGLDWRAQWEVSLVASELASNVLKFAGSGTMTLRRATDPRDALELEVVDQGSGIADLEAAVLDGYSEGAMLTADRPRRRGQGLGLGLGTVRRMSDDVSIDTGAGRGTRVVVRKYIRNTSVR